MVVDDHRRIKAAAEMIEAALKGEEPRRGIWTDRDYLVAALALLTNSDRAREAMLGPIKPLADANKPLNRRDEPWWSQYENTATTLEEDANVFESHSDLRKANSLPIPNGMIQTMRQAADDIRTLYDGLHDMERNLGEVEGPDPTERQVEDGD
jgi:hypothetical protein